jgi:hypothetical protein
MGNGEAVKVKGIRIRKWECGIRKKYKSISGIAHINTAE